MVVPSVAPVSRRAGHGADGFRNQHGYLSPIRTLLFWRAWKHAQPHSPSKIWDDPAQDDRQKLNSKSDGANRSHPRIRPQPNIQNEEDHVNGAYRHIDEEQDVMMFFGLPAKGQEEEFLPEGELFPFVHLSHHQWATIARDILLQCKPDRAVGTDREPNGVKNAHKQGAKHFFYNRIHQYISQMLSPVCPRTLVAVDLNIGFTRYSL